MTRMMPFLLAFLLIFLTACGPMDGLGPRRFLDGVAQTTPLHDGVTQTTPLITGTVRLASGAPAAGVTVRAYVSEFRVAATGGASEVTTRTDAKGRFELVDPPRGQNTIEAVASDAEKAILMKVAIADGTRRTLEPMTLLPTGTLTGNVRADEPVELLGTTVFIPGTQYAAFTSSTGAYTIQHVPVGTYQLVAMRQNYAPRVLSQVKVAPAQTVQAPDLVLSLDAPLLDSLSQTNGGPGSTIVLTGRNFGLSKKTVLSVSFGGVLATRMERASDTEIRVWVPDGAQSGPVVVQSNGIESNPLDFQVIERLTVKPYYVGAYPNEAVTFSVEARDTMGKLVPQPTFAWELGSPFLGTLSEQGKLETREEGWTKIRAISGKVAGDAAAGVTRFVRDPARSFQAAVKAPSGNVAVGPDGLYFTHTSAHRLSFRAEDGFQEIRVGSGERGYSPDGTPALQAALDSPEGLAVDAQGNLYFSERGNHLVRVVPKVSTTYLGRTLEAGRLYTLVGRHDRTSMSEKPAGGEVVLNAPSGLVLEGGGPLLGGSLMIVDALNQRILEWTSDGAIATIVGGGSARASSHGIAPLDYGGGVGFWLASDASGNLLFSDYKQLQFYCRKSGTYFGRVMAAGRLYAVAGTGEGTFLGDGPGLATPLASPRNPVFDAAGNVYFYEDGTGGLRVLREDGAVRWVAGAMLPAGYSNVPEVHGVAPATAMRLAPFTLAVRPDGALVVGDADRVAYHVLTAPLGGYSQ